MSSLTREASSESLSREDPDGDPSQTWPKEGKPHRWENNVDVCQHFRSVQNLLLWPGNNTGIVSIKALSMNKTLVFDAVEVWAQVCDEAKSPPVNFLKKEAG